MVHVPEIQIRRRSPQARRRRRRAQQQSVCCSCFLAVACVVLGIIAVRGPLVAWRKQRAELQQARAEEPNYFPVAITTDAPTYPRFGLVRITLTLLDARGRPAKVAKPPAVFIKRGGKYVETVGGVDRLIPRPGRGGAWLCNWPVPWGAPAGLYEVETRYELTDPGSWRWETVEEELARQKRESREKSRASRSPDVSGKAFCIARTTFSVVTRPPPDIPPGMCAATWEPSPPYRGQRIRKPSGEMGDWRAIFDWCEFLGADALWMRAAVTQAGPTPLTLEQPFLPDDLAAIPRFAAEAHRRGLKFGAWAVAYNTLPEDPASNGRKPPYLWAKDVSRSSGAIRDTSFVSFLDPHRGAHLAAFLKAMQADPNVDFIGLDYMRTEPGYELTDRFAVDMPGPFPAEWERMDRMARWRYVAEHAEPPGCYRRPEFYDAWNWYRAHLGSTAIADMLRRSGATKPLWVFCLSWKHGTQHGQDPLMFTDAGVSILAQMLYQIDSSGFEHVLKDWHEYLTVGQANVMGGDQVDDFWHQKLGPEELYRRMMAAHRQFVRGGRTQGAFWHDISRAAVTGILGAYPGSEWALAGAAAFSQVRETWRVYPLTASLAGPQTTPVGAWCELRLTLHNVCEAPVRRIQIKPMATEGLEWEDLGPREVVELGPRQTLTVPLRARLPGLDAARRNRFMAAVRVTWPDGRYGPDVRSDLPRVIVVMRYLQAASGKSAAR